MSEFLDCASLFVEEEDYELLKPRSDAERKQAERARMDEEQQELQKKKDRIRHQTYDPTVRRARRNNPETRPAYRRQERDRYGKLTGTPRSDSEAIMVDGESGNLECLKCACQEFNPAAGQDNPHCRCGHDSQNHMHEYLLLRAGELVLERADGSPLSHLDCFAFLADLPSEALYIGYAFNYDVMMMIKGLDDRKLRELHNRQWRMAHGFKPDRRKNPQYCTVCSRKRGDRRHKPTKAQGNPSGMSPGYAYPVDVDGFQIDYIKSKRFYVRRTPPDGHRCKPKTKCHPWIIVYDIFPHFGVSFVEALETEGVATKEELALIGVGKEQRKIFGRMTDKTREYNYFEIVLGQRLYQSRWSKYRVAKIEPRYPDGPGWLAAELFIQHKVPKAREIPYCQDDWTPEQQFNPSETPEFLRKYTPAQRFQMASKGAYYGGWFDNPAIGVIPGPSWGWDINSAYPYQLSRQPDFPNGLWVEGKRPAPGCEAYIAFVYFGPKMPNDNTLCYGLPVRDKNNGVSYPQRGSGWYWSMDIEASLHQMVTVVWCFSFVPVNDRKPFAFMEMVYEKRMEKERERKGLGVGFKLGGNSGYGKLAQTVGSAPWNDCLVRAGHLTSSVRAQNQNEVIHRLPGCQAGRCGDDVLMIATDGVFTTALPGGVRVSNELGDWKRVEYSDGMFIVRSGLYFAPGVEEKPKTRGVPRNLALAQEDNLRKAFRRAQETGDWKSANVVLKMNTFHSLGLSVLRNELDMIGRWTEDDRIVTFDWTPKRAPGFISRGTWIQVRPPEGSVRDANVSYDREMSRRFKEQQIRAGNDFSELPDWADRYYSPSEDDSPSEDE